MKLPNPNSNGRRITSLLLTGVAITPEEGILLHGTLRLTVAEIGDLYRELVVRGCAVMTSEIGPRIEASPALLDKYGLAEVSEKAKGEKVPPPTRPPFRPLSARYLPSSRGQREGSNDLRDKPSHYAKLAETAPA